jgi:hypothetical protein
MVEKRHFLEFVVINFNKNLIGFGKLPDCILSSSRQPKNYALMFFSFTTFSLSNLARSSYRDNHHFSHTTELEFYFFRFTVELEFGNLHAISLY